MNDRVADVRLAAKKKALDDALVKWHLASWEKSNSVAFETWRQVFTAAHELKSERMRPTT